jgi:hypothetical protein
MNEAELGAVHWKVVAITAFGLVFDRLKPSEDAHAPAANHDRTINSKNLQKHYLQTIRRQRSAKIASIRYEFVILF